jgi:hypothetical protein
MAHCHGAEARYQKTIYKPVSDELHLEGIAERLCRQSDSWSGIGEETRMHLTLRVKESDQHCLDI